MQVAQSIQSNSYVKGSFFKRNVEGSLTEIMIKLYKILSIVKGVLEEYIRPYIKSYQQSKPSVTTTPNKFKTRNWTHSRHGTPVWFGPSVKALPLLGITIQYSTIFLECSWHVANM